MPELEFLLKRKELIKKDAQQSYVDRLINPDPVTDEAEYKVFYTPFIIDIDDIVAVLEDDDDHTALFDRAGEVYIIKCKYRHYKYVKEHLTGHFVRNIEMFAIDDSALAKIDKINQVINATTI